MINNADDLFTLSDCGLIEEEVDFRGKRLIVRELTCAERDKLDSAWLETKSLRVALMIACVYDANDEKFFKQSDAKRLARVNSKFIEPLAEACMRVNGFYETVETQKKK